LYIIVKPDIQYPLPRQPRTKEECAKYTPLLYDIKVETRPFVGGSLENILDGVVYSALLNWLLVFAEPVETRLIGHALCIVGGQGIAMIVER
jgi:hypothetical protein